MSDCLVTLHDNLITINNCTLVYDDGVRTFEKKTLISHNMNKKETIHNHSSTSEMIVSCTSQVKVCWIISLLKPSRYLYNLEFLELASVSESALYDMTLVEE